MVHGTSSHRLNFHGSLGFAGLVWGNLLIWANISLLRRHWRFKLAHNGHEHIRHCHSSSVSQNNYTASDHTGMILYWWHLKRRLKLTKDKGPHLTVRRYDLRKTYIHLYFLSQCVSCLVTLTALGIFPSVGKLGKCAYTKKTWKVANLWVKCVETEGKKHYGRELSEKAHWEWTYIKNRKIIMEVKYIITRIRTFVMSIFSLFCEGASVTSKWRCAAPGERGQKLWHGIFVEGASMDLRFRKRNEMKRLDNNSEDGSAWVMDGKWMVIGSCEDEDEMLWNQYQ